MFHGYKLVGEIGEGSYGSVLKACRSRELTRPPWFEAVGPPYYAIKRLKTPTNSKIPVLSQVSTLREVKLLRELKHNNIINMCDLIFEGGELALVFDYAEWTMGMIIDHHKEIAKSIPEYAIKSLLWQSLKGLAYLHDSWVIHRDIKPQNILVVGEGASRGRVAIADFGLARIFRDPVFPLGKVDRTVVTLWYRAPELLLGALDYDQSIDIWSMGCIFAQLLMARDRSVIALFPGEEVKEEKAFQANQCDHVFKTLGLPQTSRWPQVEKLAEYERIRKWYDTSRAGYPKQSVLRSRVPDTNEAGFDLLSRMLELNPADRITAQDALKHHFFTQSPLPGDNAVDVLSNTGQVVESLKYPFAPPKPLMLEQSQAQDAEIARRAKEVEEKHQISVSKRPRMGSIGGDDGTAVLGDYGGRSPPHVPIARLQR